MQSKTAPQLGTLDTPEAALPDRTQPMGGAD
jgi:hypothetical protein